MLLINSSSTNIALLFLYAISLRFMLFDYKITAVFWQTLIETLNKKVISSTKKTVKKGELLLYSPESTPNIYWKGLYEIVDKLIRCPFCKGCWAGYFIYLFLVIDFSSLTLDIQQVIEFALFSGSCGFLSLVSTSKLGI
jgi:Protein of unknown function (DUF1360).